MPIEQYFQLKKDFDKDARARDQLVKDRQTLIVYGREEGSDSE